MASGQPLAAGHAAVDRTVEDFRIAVRAGDDQRGGAAAVEIDPVPRAEVLEPAAELVGGDATAPSQLPAIHRQPIQPAAVLGHAGGGAGVQFLVATMGQFAPAEDDGEPAHRVPCAFHIATGIGDPGPVGLVDHQRGALAGRGDFFAIGNEQAQHVLRLSGLAMDFVKGRGVDGGLQAVGFEKVAGQLRVGFAGALAIVGRGEEGQSFRAQVDAHRDGPQATRLGRLERGRGHALETRLPGRRDGSEVLRAEGGCRDDRAEAGKHGSNRQEPEGNRPATLERETMNETSGHDVGGKRAADGFPPFLAPRDAFRYNAATRSGFVQPHRIMKRHLFLCSLGLWLAWGVFFGAPPVAAQQKSGLHRERGAIYVEELTDKKIALHLPEAVPAYTDLTGRRSIGMLVPGQQVALVAFSEKACRVRARATHGDVVGWVGMKHLRAKDPQIFERLKQAAERQKQVEAYIAKKEIALGMTPDEVIQALGKPDEESSDVRKTGTSGSFAYVVYDRVPQRNLVRDRYGRLAQTVIYVKVETGRMTVVFENGAVSNIQTTKGRPNWNNTRIVVPPINIW